MQDHCAFDYAIVRVVPYEDRAEFINVGVVLYCRDLNFLGAKIQVDRDKLIAIAPHVNVEMVQKQLDLIPQICAGGESAGTIGQLSQEERFRWLGLPRNSAIQTSPVHCGLCKDPTVELERLFNQTASRSR